MKNLLILKLLEYQPSEDNLKYLFDIIDNISDKLKYKLDFIFIKILEHEKEAVVTFYILKRLSELGVLYNNNQKITDVAMTMNATYVLTAGGPSAISYISNLISGRITIKEEEMHDNYDRLHE